jgi:hypothetical protein
MALNIVGWLGMMVGPIMSVWILISSSASQSSPGDGDAVKESKLSGVLWWIWWKNGILTRDRAKNEWLVKRRKPRVVFMSNGGTIARPTARAFI